MHDIVMPALQVPAPLQLDAFVNVLLAQDAAPPHVVETPGKTHAFRFWAEPSHLPPHTPLPAQGVRGVVIGKHVPRFPGTLHDSH